MTTTCGNCDSPTRNNNILDLVLTNIPDKVWDLHVFEDIISTDHKLISFTLDFNIPKKPITKRFVFNYKKANWTGLNEALQNTAWDLAFIEGDIDSSLSNWCDLFLSAFSDYVPKCSVKNTSNHPWLDSELWHLIKKKNWQRRKPVQLASQRT